MTCHISFQCAKRYWGKSNRTPHVFSVFILKIHKYSLKDVCQASFGVFLMNLSYVNPPTRRHQTSAF